MDSLGRTTCLTGTDTVGADFNADAAAAIIANVDGTSASVSTALTGLNTGTLAGQVPGLGLINKIADANTAQAQFETANKAALDALAKTLKVEVTKDEQFSVELNEVSAEAQKASDIAHGGKTTTVLTAEASDAATAVTKAYAALTTKEKALADKYVAAVSTEATAKAAAATDVEKAAVEAGLATDAQGLVGLDLKYADGAAVHDAYVKGTPEARKAIDTEFKDSAYYSTFKAAVVKDAAAADAHNATLDAQDALALTPSDLAAATTAVSTAQAKVDADTTAVSTAQAAVTTATTAVSTAQAAVTTATTAVSTAQAAVTTVVAN